MKSITKVLKFIGSRNTKTTSEIPEISVSVYSKDSSTVLFCIDKWGVSDVYSLDRLGSVLELFNICTSDLNTIIHEVGEMVNSIDCEEDEEVDDGE